MSKLRPRPLFGPWLGGPCPPWPPPPPPPGSYAYDMYHHLSSTNLPKTTKVCSSQCTTKVIHWTQRDLFTLQSPKLVRLTLIPGLSLIVCQVPTIHCTTLYTSPLPQGHHFFHSQSIFILKKHNKRWRPTFCRGYYDDAAILETGNDTDNSSALVSFSSNTRTNTTWLY